MHSRTYHHDLLGELDQRQSPNNGLVQDFTYTALGQLKTQTIYHGGDRMQRTPAIKESGLAFLPNPLLTARLFYRPASGRERYRGATLQRRRSRRSRWLR